jgi:DNA-binding LytR/AlgR family response regulator
MGAVLNSLTGLEENFSKAKVLLEKHEYANANSILVELVKHAVGDNCEKLRGDILSLMGDCNFYLGNYQQSIEQFKEAESIFKKLKLMLELAGNAGNLGAVYKRLGLYSLSMLKYLESMTYLFETGDDLSIASSLMNAASALYDAGYPEKAYRALDSAFALCDKHAGSTNYEEIRLLILNNKATYYLRSSKYEDAFDLLKDAKSLAKKFSIDNQLMTIESNHILCLIRLNRLDEAYQLLSPVLSKRKKVYDDHYVADLVKMGILERDLKKNDEKFFEYLNKALKIADSKKLLSRIIFINQVLRDHFLKRNDKAGAEKFVSALKALEEQDKVNKQTGGLEKLFDAKLFSIEAKLHKKEQKPALFSRFNYLTGTYSYTQHGITKHIPLRDIAFCEVKGNYMSIYTYVSNPSGSEALHETCRLRKTMKEFISELEDSGTFFTRIHNSFIINLSYLSNDSLKSCEVLHIAGKELKISDTYRKTFKESANAFFRHENHFALAS